MEKDGWIDDFVKFCFVYTIRKSSFNAQGPHTVPAQPLVDFCSVLRIDRIALPISKFPQRPFVLSVEGSSAVVQLVLVSSYCNRTVISRLLDGNCT